MQIDSAPASADDNVKSGRWLLPQMHRHAPSFVVEQPVAAAEEFVAVINTAVAHHVAGDDASRAILPPKE